MGRMILLVDEVLDSGDEEHRRRMDRLQEIFRFGKYKSLRQRGGGVFNGRRVIQKDGYSIEANMTDYIAMKLKEITIPSSRRANPQDPVTEGERAELRSAAMSIMWMAREARPDVLGPVSILARHITEARVEHFVEAAKITSHARATWDLGLIFKSIPPEEAVIVVFADGAAHT